MTPFLRRDDGSHIAIRSGDVERLYSDTRTRQMETERRMGAPTMWGWIAGAVFIIVILALVFAGGESTRTAREDANPAATTGMAPRTAPPAVAVPPAAAL